MKRAKVNPFSIFYVCSSCQLNTHSNQLMFHVSSCERTPPGSSPSFQFISSQIFEFFEHRINQKIYKIHSLLFESNKPNKNISDKDLERLVKKLQKLKSFKGKKNFSLQEIEYLEKVVFFSNYSISEQGKLLTTYNHYSNIKNFSRFWNINNGKRFNVYCSMNLNYYKKKLNLIRCIAFDGALIAYSNYQYLLIYHQLKNIIIFYYPKKNLKHIDIAEKPKFLAFDFKKIYIKIINFENLSLVCKFSYENQEISKFSFSSNKKLIYADYLKAVVIFDLTSKNHKTLTKIKQNIDEKIDESRKFFLVTSKNNFLIYFEKDIVFYNLIQNSEYDTINVTGLVLTAGFIQNDSKLIYSTIDGSIYIYTIANKTSEYLLKNSSEFHIEKHGNYLIFELGLIFDINEKKENTKLVPSDIKEVMDLNTLSNFSRMFLDTKTVLINQKRFTYNGGNLSVSHFYFSNEFQRTSLNYLNFKGKLLKFFKIDGMKVFITMNSSLNFTFKFDVIDDFVYISSSYLPSHLSLSKDLRYLYLKETESIHSWDILKMKYNEVSYLNIENNVLEKRKLHEKCVPLGNRSYMNRQDIENFTGFTFNHSKKYLVFIDKKLNIITFNAVSTNGNIFKDTKMIKFHKETDDYALLLNRNNLRIFKFSSKSVIYNKVIEDFEIEKSFSKKIASNIIIVTKSMIRLFNITTFETTLLASYETLENFIVKFFKYDFLIILISNCTARIINIENPTEKKQIFNKYLDHKDKINLIKEKSRVIILGVDKVYIYDLKSCNLIGTVDHMIFSPISYKLHTFRDSIYAVIFFIQTEIGQNQQTFLQFLVIDCMQINLYSVSNLPNYSLIPKLAFEKNEWKVFTSQEMLIIRASEPFECKILNIKYFWTLLDYKSQNYGVPYRYSQNSGGLIDFLYENTNNLNKLATYYSNNIYINHNFTKSFKLEGNKLTISNLLSNIIYTDSKIKDIDDVYVLDDRYVLLFKLNDLRYCKNCRFRSKCMCQAFSYIILNQYNINSKLVTYFDINIFQELMKNKNLSFLVKHFNDSKILRKIINRNYEDRDSNTGYINNDINYLLLISSTQLSIINLSLKNASNPVFYLSNFQNLKISNYLKFIIFSDALDKVYWFNLIESTTKKVFIDIRKVKILYVSDQGSLYCYNKEHREFFSLFYE